MAWVVLPTCQCVQQMQSEPCKSTEAEAINGSLPSKVLPMEANIRPARTYKDMSRRNSSVDQKFNQLKSVAWRTVVRFFHTLGFDPPLALFWF